MGGMGVTVGEWVIQIKWQMLMEVGVQDKDEVEGGGYGWGEGGRYG